MHQQKPATILVVDDEPLNLEIIMHGLGKHGHNIKCTANAEEALVLLNNSPDDFDIVLLDWQLPGMNGLELLRKIKEYEKFRNIPVVMQTAMGQKKDIDEGIEAGAYYYLTKPYESKDLADIVSRAIFDAQEEKHHLEELQNNTPEKQESADSLEITMKTLEEIDRATQEFASLFPDPSRVTIGIHELLMNALEHGNLEISYEEKTELLKENTWEEEIAKRLKIPENLNKTVTAKFEKDGSKAILTVIDEGKGFDWKPFLDFSSDRATDIHGRGIAICVKRCFDELVYEPPGNKVIASVKL